MSQGAKRRGRSHGGVRTALQRAVRPFVGVGATWRELAELACVGREAARRTADNMARAGELAIVGVRREPGVCRPMRLYAPQEMPESAAVCELERAVRGWRHRGD